MKKYFLFYLMINFGIIGCSSKPAVENQVPQADLCKDFTPNALSSNKCEKFWNEQRLNKQANVISQKVADWFVELEKNFKTKSLEQLYFSQYAANSDDHIEIGRDLSERKKSGDRTPIHLAQLGWTASVDNSDEVISAPNSYIEIFQKAYALLTEGHENLATDETLILPALTFKRASKKKRTEYLIVRPGIDPIPKKEEGWQINLSSLASVPDNDLMIWFSEGKFPVDWTASLQDFNRIVDFLETPEFASQMRQFYSAEKIFLSTANQNEKIRVRLADMEMLVSEYNYKIKQVGIAVLDKVFGSNTGFLDRDSLVKKYSEMELPDLAATLTRFDQMYYQIVETFGGSARDGTTENDVRQIEAVAVASLKGENPKPNISIKYILDDTSGQLIEAKTLALLLTLPAEQKKFLKKVNKGNSKSSSQEMLSEAQHQLGLLLAKIEYRVRLGQEIPLTPSQMTSDLTQLISTQNFENYKASATYRYYLQASETDSIQRKILVEVVD